MHLGAFVHETGQHVTAWRHPEAHYHSCVRELQRRGLFRTEYEATTLRGNLGLPKPVNRRHRARPASAAE
ncbi:MAG: hypothetical protein JSS04_24910 [Proteobacteria bacterium]|nr:hypothetical protein [Pseudomonadota bacterium]